MILQTGEFILDGKYRVEEFLGKGAYGEVYRVIPERLQKSRAVKTLRRDMLDISEKDYLLYRGRFELEANLGDQISHPNVIRVYEFHEIKDELYLVMEYAIGKTLRDKLDNISRLTAEATIRIGLEICRGLSAIHRMEVIHRDLKPSNILFDERGQAKIADLGLAQVEGYSRRSLNGEMAEPHPGSIGYMSPEQESTRQYLTPASDFYALGCILFECLTGMRYAKFKGLRIRQQLIDVPLWLDHLIFELVQDDMRARPQSAEDIEEMLREKRSVNIQYPGYAFSFDLPSIALTKETVARTPLELAILSEKVWDVTVDFFWRGRIDKWLTDCIAKLLANFQFPLADEWERTSQFAQEIRKHGEPNDPIERSALVVEFLRHIQGYQPPILEVAPKDLLDFGEVVLGNPSNASLGIRNGAAGVLEGQVSSNSKELKIATDGRFRCGPNESLEIPASLTIDDISKLQTKFILRIKSNVGNFELPIKASINPPKLELSPTEIEFRDIEQEPIKLTLRNQGGSILKGTSQVTVPWLSISSSGRSFNILPAAELEIVITLKAEQVPAGGIKTPNAIMLDTNAGHFDIGVVVPAPPILQVEPALIDFGTIGGEIEVAQIPMHKLSVNNAGTGTLTGRIKVLPNWLALSSQLDFACKAGEKKDWDIYVAKQLPRAPILSSSQVDDALAVESNGGKATVRVKYALPPIENPSEEPVQSAAPAEAKTHAQQDNGSLTVILLSVSAIVVVGIILVMIGILIARPQSIPQPAPTTSNPAGTTASTQPVATDSFAQEAQRRLDTGNVSEALVAAQMGLDRNPADLAPFIEVAERMFKWGYYAESEALLRSISLHTQDRTVVALLAWTLYEQGHYQDAVGHFDKCLAEATDTPLLGRCTAGKGFSLLAMGNTTEGEQLLLIAFDKMGDESDKFANDLMFQKNYPEVERFTRIVRLNRAGNIAILFWLAWSLYEQEKYEDALGHFNLCVAQASPGYVLGRCHAGKGFALNKLGRQGEAKDAFRKALEIYSDQMDVQSTLGSLP